MPPDAIWTFASFCLYLLFPKYFLNSVSVVDTSPLCFIMSSKNLSLVFLSICIPLKCTHLSNILCSCFTLRSLWLICCLICLKHSFLSGVFKYRKLAQLLIIPRLVATSESLALFRQDSIVCNVYQYALHSEHLCDLKPSFKILVQLTWRIVEELESKNATTVPPVS